MNVLCSAKACPVLLSSTCVFYEGEDLVYTGINTNDTVQLALQKIDAAFANSILDISAILPISVTPGPNPVISISQASATSNGYLSSTNWSTFNNKQNAITLTTTGSSGPATFNGTSGALNIPDYSGTFSGFVPTSRTLTINGVSQDLSANRTWSVGTVTSVDMSVPTGFSISGNPITSSGTFAVTFASGYSLPTNTSQSNWDVAYNNRITSLTTTGSSGSATLISNTLNIPTYTLSGLGGVPSSRQLTINGVAFDLSADRSWSVGTVTSVGTSGPITGGTITGIGTIGITQSSSSTDGYLSSGDWTIFNSKQAQLNGTGFVKASGTTITYDNSTYYLASNPNAYIALTALSSGTGINYNNTTGVITNSAPDQTVSLANGTGINVTGTYPSFTITNTAPDQVVTLTQGGTTVITGTYPNFTISSSDAFVGTVTSVSGTGTVSGLTLSGTVTSSGNLTLGGSLTLTSLQITTGLGYTPYNSTNPSGFVNYNIYTSDGILAGDRYIDGNDKNLWINDINTLRVTTGTAGTNNVALFESTEPNINIRAIGGTNGAAVFLSPSAGFNGAIHNRTGGGLEFYTGATPSLYMVLQSTGQLRLNAYTSTSSFSGTAAGYLGFDASGNILTVAAGGGGSVTSIATSGPITGGTITTSGTIGITQSTTSTDGYLSSTDWNTFNNKVSSNIYTDNGTLTGNRTVGTTSGFTLTFNPQTSVLTTLTAPTNASSYALLSQNTVNYVSGFSSSSLGSTYGGNASFSLQTFAGNATFDNANLAAAHTSVNSINFSAAGSNLITMTQSTSPGIRAMAAHMAQFQYTKVNSGTISHLAIQQNLGIYIPSSGSGVLTISNGYSLLINPLDDYGTGNLSITNRWGIYQASPLDNNYFAGKTIIGPSNAVGGATSFKVTGLPTSSAGLSTGDVWNNSGVLTVV